MWLANNGILYTWCTKGVVHKLKGVRSHAHKEATAKKEVKPWNGRNQQATLNGTVATLWVSGCST